MHCHKDIQFCSYFAWFFCCFHLQSHFCQTDQLLYSYIWMSHPFDFSCSYNKHLDEWISFSITIWDRNTLYCCQWTEEIFEEHLKVLLPKSHSLANLFIPSKVAKICNELNKTESLSLNDSILKFYNSSVYETLSRESSKLWQEGWVYIYQMLV